MMWFGESWGAPACEPERRTHVPVGAECVECDRPIVAGDRGFVTAAPDQLTVFVAYHLICFLRTVIPCTMWTPEMLVDIPPRWAQHRAEHHNTPSN